jgi:hypothetical protein
VQSDDTSDIRNSGGPSLRTSRVLTRYLVSGIRVNDSLEDSMEEKLLKLWTIESKRN